MVELSWWLPWATKRALYLFYYLISISVTSKTFWEIKDEISFSNAIVHVWGLDDFEKNDMDHGIQIEGFEEIECDGMFVEVIGVNILTDWCVVGKSEVCGVSPLK